MASSTVEHLFCRDIPGIPIIAIGINPKTYLVHAHKVVSLLINKPARSTSRTALDNFLKSDAGKHIQQDGDLTEAHHRGTISAMIYTHKFKYGSPSRFATLDGLKEIITHLPNQDESAKVKYHGLFNEYFTQLKAPLAFELTTQEQCLRNMEDDDMLPEIQTEGVQGSTHSNDHTFIVTPKMYVDCLINHNEAEKRLFQEKLDMVMKNATLEKDKITLEKDKITLEKDKITLEKDKALLEKDKTLLEMQLKMQEEKSAFMQKELDFERLRREYEVRMLRKTPPDDTRKKRAKKSTPTIPGDEAIDSPPQEPGTMVNQSSVVNHTVAPINISGASLANLPNILPTNHRVSLVGISSVFPANQGIPSANLPSITNHDIQKQTLFSKLCCVAHNNFDPYVDFFVDLPHDHEVRNEQQQIFKRVPLVVRMAGDPNNGEISRICKDNKFHVLALAYKGDRLTRQQLHEAKVIREAHGVERNGLQFICLVLDHAHGRRIPSIGNALYDLKLLPSSITPERIEAQHPGDDWRHISVLKTRVVTNDPVLTELKAPNGSKWRWIS